MDKWTKVLAILQLVDEFIVPLVERIKKIFGKYGDLLWQDADVLHAVVLVGYSVKQLLALASAIFVLVLCVEALESK